MGSLVQYRMNNLDWIDRFISEMGIEEFSSFDKRVRNALDKLKVNYYYDIAESVIPSQQELFIKLCCLHIEQHPEYEFNDDYTQIWRKEIHEQWEMETRRRRLHSEIRR